MKKLKYIKSGIICLILLSASYSIAPGQNKKGTNNSSTPLLDIISQFTASNVPKLASSEEVVSSLKPDTVHVPENLPGKGLGQHSMLYFGECYNILYLIHEGQIKWTYQTGDGCEYDDVWMMSNGNILFTRMQYIAIITPGKESTVIRMMFSGKNRRLLMKYHS